MKTLIAIPSMDMVHTQFMLSLIGMRRIGETIIANSQATVIHTSRDILARHAIEMQCDRVLWLDSDMKFGSDIMERLCADMDEGREMVSAIYFGRRYPVTPIIYESIDYNPQDADSAGVPNIYHDYPEDSIFPVAGCGFGACMMSAQLLTRVKQRFRYPFQPIPGLGEDIAFCWRAAQVGAKIYCDSRIKPYHIGMYNYSEADYMGQEPL